MSSSGWVPFHGASSSRALVAAVVLVLLVVFLVLGIGRLGPVPSFALSSSSVLVVLVVLGLALDGMVLVHLVQLAPIKVKRHLLALAAAALPPALSRSGICCWNSLHEACGFLLGLRSLCVALASEALAPVCAGAVLLPHF